MKGERRISSRKGIFVVIDGLDGIGKGEIERALIEYEQKLGRTVFDTMSFCRASKKGLPEIKDFWNPPFIAYDTIIGAEPTYSGIGDVVRNEIVVKNSRPYSSKIQTEAYSLDRLISMMRLVIPALQNGLRVIQSRCCSTTLVYQTLKAIEEGKDPKRIRKEILSHPGNKLQLSWAPDLLIIPTIKDVDTSLMKRISERKKYKKEDNSIFDEANFLKKSKSAFEDPRLKKLFESHGSKVVYLDAGISVEETKKQAIKIYEDFLKEKNLI